MDDFLTENGLDAADVELLDQKIDNQPAIPAVQNTGDIVTINTSKANLANNTNVLSSISTISIHASVSTTVSPVVQPSPAVSQSMNNSPNQSPYGSKITSTNSSLSGFEYGYSPRGTGDLSSLMSGNDSSSSSDDYDNFNPGMRKFTDEELKPQPMLKKSRKVTRVYFCYFCHD